MWIILRDAMRPIRRAPGLTLLVVTILTLAMGANLATFSITDALLFRVLPVKEPGSLFRTVNASGNPYDSGGGSSYPLFLEMQRRTSEFARLMAYRAAELTSVSIDHSAPERLMEQTVSGNYFDILGVQPIFGRMISSADDSAPGQHPVAVFSYRIWKDKLNSNPAAIGTKLSLDNRVYEVIGIAPPQFFGVEIGKFVDVWTPISMAAPATLSDDHDFWLRTMGRLKTGVAIAKAVAPMQAVSSEFMEEDVRLHAPPGTPKEVIAQFLAGTRITGVPAGAGISSLRRQYERPLQITLCTVGLVMLIACSNVANLLIASAAARQQEMTTRLSLGAGKARIFQQILTESFVLATLAALVALLLVHLVMPALIGWLTPSTNPADLVTAIDFRLLGITLLLTLTAAIVCGLAPALRLANSDLSMKSCPRLASSTSAGRTQKAILVAQVALSLVLIIAAGLFARTLANLLSLDLGFNPSHLLVARLTLQDSKLSHVSAWSNLLREVRSIPAVTHASLSSTALFAGDPQLRGVRTTATQSPPPDPVAGLAFVSPDCFSTLGIEFVGGRDFRTFDEGPANSAVAIVNQAFTRKFFGAENPLGRKLSQLANAPSWTEIVGVVTNSKVSNLREDAHPMIYIPYSRMTDWVPPQGRPGVSMFLLVRGQQDVSSLTANLRRRLSPSFFIEGVFRQEQLMSDTLIREKLLGRIAGFFGVLAIVMAAVGLYGLMSCQAGQRRQELAMRIALGAERHSLLRLMLLDSFKVVAPGILLGLLLSSLATQSTKTLIYGLAPNDPATFFFSSAVLLAASLLAAFIPAYRATKADPLVALRHE